MNRRALVVGGAGLAIVLAGVLTATGAVPDPTHATALCVDCHTDIRDSHAAGTHADLDCLDCHLAPGLHGEIAGRWDGVRHLRLGWTQDPASPHHPPLARVDDANCRRCHDTAKLSDELDGDAANAVSGLPVALQGIGLRTNHGGHESARASCLPCHGPTLRPQSIDPLGCTVCHQTTGHDRERTARARSFGHEPMLPVPPPPVPPPPPVDPDAEDEEDEWADAEAEPPVRCSPRGIQRCGTCHNGLSHGNGTKPAGLPSVLEAGDPFTCRRCHHKGRRF